MIIYDNALNSLIPLFVILGSVILIALIAYVIYKYFIKKSKNSSWNSKKSEEENVTEELNRVLQDVEDEDVAKKISEYKEKDED